MARSYRHIQQYEKEILKLKEKGLTHNEIAQQLGFTKEQVKEFIHRKHRKDRRIAAGIALKKKGRPPKEDKYIQTDKINELKYIIARKDAKIKALCVVLLRVTLLYYAQVIKQHAVAVINFFPAAVISKEECFFLSVKKL